MFSSQEEAQLARISIDRLLILRFDDSAQRLQQELPSVPVCYKPLNS